MRSRSAAGFTLIEVVLALSLMSVLMLGLVSALRSFGQTGERLERQTMANDDVRLVSSLLYRAIGRSSSRLRQDAPETNGKLWFAGDGQSLSWAGQLPARHGAGGLTHLRLLREGREDGEGGPYLMLYMARFDGDQHSPEWLVDNRRILLEQVDGLEIRYQGLDQAGERAWFEDWFDQTRLPFMVQLLLTVRGRAWPPIVIQLEDGLGSVPAPRAGQQTPLRWR
jgi:general secretion pathway protein J